MKDRRRFLVQVGKRFALLGSAPIAGIIIANILFAGTLILWLLGFIVIPAGILTSGWLGQKDPEDPRLPDWAQWWDDSEDLELRGRPAGMFVWNFDMGWAAATFVYLQFYNPLANLRVRVKERHRQASGRT